MVHTTYRVHKPIYIILHAVRICIIILIDPQIYIRIPDVFLDLHFNLICRRQRTVDVYIL